MGYYWVWDEDTEEYKKASDFYCNLIGYANIPQAEAEDFDQSKIFTLPQNHYNNDSNYYLTEEYLKAFGAAAFSEVHFHNDDQPLPFTTSAIKLALPKRDYEKDCPWTRKTATNDNYIPFKTKYLLAAPNTGLNPSDTYTNKKFPGYLKSSSPRDTLYFWGANQQVLLLWYADDTQEIRIQELNDIIEPTFPNLGTITDKSCTITGFDPKNRLTGENGMIDLTKDIPNGNCKLSSEALGKIARLIKANPSSYGRPLFENDAKHEYSKSYIYIALQGPGAGGGGGQLGHIGIWAVCRGGVGGSGGAFMTLALNPSKAPGTVYLLYPGYGTRPGRLTSHPGWEIFSSSVSPFGSFLACYPKTKATSDNTFEFVAYAGGGAAGDIGAVSMDEFAPGLKGGATAFIPQDNLIIINKICGGDSGKQAAFLQRALGFLGGYYDRHAKPGTDAMNTISWSPIYSTSYTIDKTTKVKNLWSKEVYMTVGGTESLAGTSGWTSAGSGGGGAVCAGRYDDPTQSSRTRGRELLGYGGGGYASSAETAEVHNGGWGLPGFIAIIDVY